MRKKLFFLFFLVLSAHAMHRVDAKKMHARRSQARVIRTDHQMTPDYLPAFRSKCTMLPQVGGWGAVLLFLMCSGMLVDQVQAYKPFSQDDLWRCARYPLCCNGTGPGCRSHRLCTDFNVQKFIEENIKDCRYCKEHELFSTCDRCDRHAWRVDEFRERYSDFCHFCFWEITNKKEKKDDL